MSSNWTPEEAESLRTWAAILDPDFGGAVCLTHARSPEDTLSLAEMLEPDWNYGRIGPELSALVQVSVADLLLFRRVFLAALAQAQAGTVEGEGA